MRYPAFEKQGFCTSTGVVESGCKVVVGTRLKRAGMHWTVKGANAIIAVSSADASKTSGNAAQSGSGRLHDSTPKSDVRPSVCTVLPPETCHRSANRLRLRSTVCKLRVFSGRILDFRGLELLPTIR